MDKKVAKGTVKGVQPRTWNTNGRPSTPLPKVWNGAGKVVRNAERKGGGK